MKYQLDYLQNVPTRIELSTTKKKNVIRDALPSIRLLINWILSVKYQIHATGTIYSLAEHLEEFVATKVIFTTYKNSTTTDTIIYLPRKNLKMQYTQATQD